MANLTTKPPVKTIHINVSGPVQSGKSAILASIRELLETHGYCVAVPNREERNNPSATLVSANQHERPEVDGTVIALTEDCA